MLDRSTFAATLVLAAALAACGGGGGGGPIPRTACDYGDYCNEYEGATLDVPRTDVSCARTGGTAMAACPAEGVLGLCTRLRDEITIRDYHYDPATLDLVRASCTASGDTWTVP